jgi:hypothetical protein
VLPFVPRRLVAAPVLTAAVGTALMVAVTGAFLAAVRTRHAMPVLIAVVALDLGWWGLSYVWHTRPRNLAALTRLVPPAMPETRYDWTDEWRNRPVLKGHRLAWGYAGLFPATTLRPESAAFLQLAGAAGRVTADGTVVPLPDAAPRARFASGAPAPLAIVTDRPGHIVVRTNAAEPQQLVITERVHDGWHAAIDGTAVPVVAFAGDFLACDVPPGWHQITFRFMPRSFVFGAMLSGAGIVALLLSAMLLRRSRPAAP